MSYLSWNDYRRAMLGPAPPGYRREIWSDMAREIRPQWEAQRAAWEQNAPSQQAPQQPKPPPWQGVPTGGGPTWGNPVTPRMPGGQWQGWGPQIMTGGGYQAPGWGGLGGMQMSQGFDLGDIQNLRGGGGRPSFAGSLFQPNTRGQPLDWSGGRLRSNQHPLTQRAPRQGPGNVRQARQAQKWRDHRAGVRAERQENRRSRRSARTIRGLTGG